MDALINASRNSEGIRNLIDRYYEYDFVQGFALGVHGNYISMFRSQFGKDISINSILEYKKIPQAWPEACKLSDLPTEISPIYVVIYVTISPDDFRTKYEVPLITDSGNHYIIIEKKGPYIANADRSKHRPKIMGGISISNAYPNIAGTLGGFLEETTSGGDLYLSSCNHVFCDLYNTDILQPGKSDGGYYISNIVANVTHEIPLILPSGFKASSPFNSVDTALAKADTVAIGVDATIRLVGGVGNVKPKGDVELGDNVIFVGKESDRQEARVYRLISRLKVEINHTIYNFGEVFEIESRLPIYIGSLSKPGDSGSWIVQDITYFDKDIYGILFAGSGNFSICCFMETVISEVNSLKSENFKIA